MLYNFTLLKCFFALCLLFLFANHGDAARPVPVEGIQPYGLQLYCTDVDCVASLDKFKNTFKINPSSSPRILETKSPSSFFERSTISVADRIFSQNPLVALLLIDNGKIVYERYHDYITSNTPLIGYSMSKSLTSMAVGQALCNGVIGSIDSKAKDVNPILNGIVYGDATVRQLLSMSSGAVRGTDTGAPIKGLGAPRNTEVYWSTLEQLKKGNAYQEKSNGEFVKAGEEFSYKNNDTQTLAYLFDTKGERSFQSVFEKYVWQAAGAESSGYWVHDKDNIVYTFMSFHATARDWARVALYIVDQLKSDPSSCFGKYLKEATTKRITNNSRSHGAEHTNGINFSGYGYQFWTNPNRDSSDVFYMVGYRGQRIAINPVKNRIMVSFAYQESYVGELYDFFSRW